MQYIGFRLPFSFGSVDDSLNNDTIDSIRDNLTNLFATEPGDRLFHPQLGVSFRKYLFEQMDVDLDDFTAIVQEDIETQVRRWMPFISVDKVKIIKTADRSQYNIIVDFHLIKNPALFSSVEVSTPAGAY